MGQSEVMIGFEIVLEEIDNAIAALNQQGAQACQFRAIGPATPVASHGHCELW